jgi:hypothetical protein
VGPDDRRGEGYANNFVFLPRGEAEALAARLRARVRALGLATRLGAVVRA